MRTLWRRLTSLVVGQVSAGSSNTKDGAYRRVEPAGCMMLCFGIGSFGVDGLSEGIRHAGVY